MAQIERVSISASIAKPVADRLEAESEARMIGKGVLVEKALSFYLDRLPAVQVEAEDRPTSARLADPS